MRYISEQWFGERYEVSEPDTGGKVYIALRPGRYRIVDGKLFRIERWTEQQPPTTT